MAAICFYFQMHQPLRINPEADRLEDIFQSAEEATDNKKILSRVVERCYVPATKLLLKLLTENCNFKVSFSISGVLLDQFESDFPEVIELFQKLNATGQVEFLNETYYHSLASIYSESEFVEQVKLQRTKINELFGQESTTFRNTEIIYSDSISELVKSLGYKTLLAEGADRILKWKSPNFLFKTTSGMNLLLKNYKLSDDIAFRFADKSSCDYPITLEKYLRRLIKINNIEADVVNLFMDYETFGEHQWKETGIFEFFDTLIAKLSEQKIQFIFPSQAETQFTAHEVINMPNYVSWADYERDVSAWTSNDMQKQSIQQIYALEKQVKEKNDPKLLKIWRYLQTSDHFYYMCTKKYGGENSDIDVHSYFSPFGTQQKAFEAYQNALRIFKASL